MLLRLIPHEARRRPGSLLLVGCICLLGCGSLVAGLGLLDHLGAVARYAISGSTDEHSLTILPETPDHAGGVLSFQRSLLDADDEAFVRGLAGLHDLRVIHGVPLPAELAVRMPPMFDSEQFVGIVSLATEDVPTDLQDAWAATSGPWPLLANPGIVNLYNFSLADRYGLPRLSQNSLQEMHMELVFGEDRFRRLATTVKVRAVLAGFSGDVDTWSIAVPRHRAERVIAHILGEVPATAGPIRFIAEFSDPEGFAAARQACIDRGLVILGDDQLAAAVSRGQTTVRWLLLFAAALGGLLIAAATAALASAIVAERRDALIRYRACGASTSQCWLLFAGGLLLAAGAGALAGGLTGHALLPRLAAPFVELLLGPAEGRLLPVPTLERSGWLPLLGSAASLLLTGLAAWPPVALACRRHG